MLPLSLFSRLFPRRPRCQSLVTERAVAVIDHVIWDVGVEALVGGTFVLDKKFRLRFSVMPAVSDRRVHAAIAVGDIAEAELFRRIGYDDPIGPALLKAHSRTLAQAVVRELGQRSPALRALPQQAH